MGIKLLKSVNFGPAKGGLDTVGYSVYYSTGSISGSRSTSGVHEVGTNTGIYAAEIEFSTFFSGSILCDTGDSVTKYATEDYNGVEESVEFVKNIEGGKWELDSDTNQMVFYKSDNTTEVARFNMFDSDNNASVSNVFKRERSS